MREGINIFEEDFWAITDILNRLLQGTNARTILLIDKAGQLITSSGDTAKIDVSSFATLSAADFAATSQLASLIGEKEFSVLFHEGERDNLHISLVAQRVILVVIFDKRSSIGLVRLRVKKASDELGRTIHLTLDGHDRQIAATPAGDHGNHYRPTEEHLAD